jgi:hypothetical protein
MQRKTLAALILAITGLILLFFNIHTALYVGDVFFNERAHVDWHVNNYFIVPSFVAYIGFAFTPLLVGSFFAGVTMLAFFTKLTQRKTALFIGCFFTAIAMSALGFNTFDWMLGCFYWPNGADATVIVDLMFASFPMNAWNFYFFCFIVPLWASGFMLGLAAILPSARFPRQKK